MIKQTMMFTNPASLSLKNEQLVISISDSPDVITRPIEDIGYIVVENQMVKMTVPLLNALADNNVSVIFCDNKKMPNSMLMSLNGNSTLQLAHRYQILASEPTKKRLWKQIIERKIKNQSALLDKLEKDGALLKPFYMNVKSGDPDNREGAASRIYWKLMFETHFLREREGEAPNNMLNYGYAILRAAVARALVGSGLYPALGIFHKNQYNAFPLADDMMEPYRPFVDEIVYRLYVDGANDDLNKTVKSELLRILFTDVVMGEIKRPLEIALTMTTASLLRCFKGEAKKLSLPELT